MNSDDWKSQYKEWKPLKPFQIKLLDEGPQSLSQSWLVNSMWCEWKSMKMIRDTELPEIESQKLKDPWID
tara:strand:+ start:301 stop:510 length:210 start_codon:yes stop_codon:yes gene_type:complete